MSSVVVKESAAEKIVEIAKKEGKGGFGLRVAVVGGGCSGYQYGMAFEKDPTEDDEVIKVNGLRIFIDPMSSMYLKGATVDYVETLNGAGFKIENPNASSSCACGQSFDA